MTLPIHASPLSTFPARFGALSLTMLGASAGPGGAVAQVTKLTQLLVTGTPNPKEADVGLPGAGTGTTPGATGTQAAEETSPGRTGTEGESSESRGLSLTDQRERGLRRIRHRMMHLARALGRLRGTGVTIYSGASASVSLGRGDAQVAMASYGGNDAVSVSAREVSGIWTGTGQDAVTVSADTVSNVHTDVDPNLRLPAGNDAVAIEARAVERVYTSGGNDAVAIVAAQVQGIYTGRGDDALSLSAGVVGGIYTGAGRDAVSIEAGSGRSQLGGALLDLTDDSVETRLWAARSALADVNTGGGNDAITLDVQGSLALAAGRGDDAITLGGGTVALHYEAGDGDDTVMLAPGSEVLVQIGADVGDWSVTRDGDSLLLTLGEGSILFGGVGTSAAIGILRAGDTEVELLHAQLPLDAVA